MLLILSSYIRSTSSFYFYSVSIYLYSSFYSLFLLSAIKLQVISIFITHITQHQHRKHIMCTHIISLSCAIVSLLFFLPSTITSAAPQIEHKHVDHLGRFHATIE